MLGEEGGQQCPGSGRLWVVGHSHRDTVALRTPWLLARSQLGPVLPQLRRYLRPCRAVTITGSLLTGGSALTPTFTSRFWGSLAEYLPTHSICTLPLTTSFCLGMGTSTFRDGKVSAG